MDEDWCVFFIGVVRLLLFLVVFVVVVLLLIDLVVDVPPPSAVVKRVLDDEFVHDGKPLAVVKGDASGGDGRAGELDETDAATCGGDGGVIAGDRDTVAGVVGTGDEDVELDLRHLFGFLVVVFSLLLA